MRIQLFQDIIDKIRGKKKSIHREIDNGYDSALSIQYYDYLKKLHNYIKPNIYLEIGVRDGDSLRYAKKPTIAIGIDPNPKFHKKNNQSNIHICKQTSDDFFANNNIEKQFGKKIDMAFIDGMHLFEFSLRDFINVEKNSYKDTVIIIHDTIPVDEISSRRERVQRFWTGDVFKIVLALKKYRPDLTILNMDVAPTGLCCITNLNPESVILEKNYIKILDEFMSLTFNDIEFERQKNLSIESDSNKFLNYLQERIKK